MDAPKQFLTHINGLRGLAILAIVLYHLSASLSPCGYFGVDVFLVISGYFLFRNDIPRLADGRLRLRDYAARKLWRIVPPWMAVALPVTLLCIYLMAYERNVTIAGTVGATAFGFANDYVAFSGSYFNPHVQQNPLMHLWYIGLTEQIYILLPLLALLPARCGKLAARLTLTAAGILSLLLCAFLNYGQQVAAWADTVASLNAEWIRPYYSVFSRLWEPLLGAAIAGLSLSPGAEATRRENNSTVCPRGSVDGNSAIGGNGGGESQSDDAGKSADCGAKAHGKAARIARGTLALTALAAFIASCYLPETGSAMSLPAALAAALLILFAAEGPAARLLNLPPLQWLGSASFSLYLVHWPVIVIWQYCCLWQPGAWDMVGMALLSVPLTWLLYRGVETRCGRRASRLSRRSRLSLALIPHGLIAAWSLSMTQGNFMEEVLPSGLPESISGYTHRYPRGKTDGIDIEALKKPYPEGIAVLGENSDAPLRFLLIGDSHAWHLADGLDRACTADGSLRGIYLRAAVVPAWDCRIILLAGSSVWDRARGEALMEWLSKQPDIRAVVISDHWWLRLQPEAIRDWSGNNIPAEHYLSAVEAGLIETCRRIVSLGKTPVILRDSPKFLGEDPFERALMYNVTGRSLPNPAVSPEQHAANTETERRLIANIAAAVPELRVLDAAPALLIDGRYPYLDERGRLLYRDTNHVSSYGSRRVGADLLQGLLPLLGGSNAEKPNK